MSIGVILNARINSPHRLTRLETCFHRILESSELQSFSVRLRGTYAREASELVIAMLSNHKIPNIIRVADTFYDWRSNTLEQVLDFRHSNYLLIQEDHILQCTIEEFDHLLQEAQTLKIDVVNTSAFFTYGEMREYLENLPEFSRTEHLVYGQLTARLLKTINAHLLTPRYPVSLLSLVSRDFIVDLLTTYRPFYRRFHFNTPFDFEQGPSQKWYLPKIVALPTSEIFCCIDDDTKIPGSSLHSRGLYPLDFVRKNEQKAGISLSFERFLRNITENKAIVKTKDYVPISIKNQIKNHVEKLDSVFFTIDNLRRIVGFDKQFLKRRRINRYARGRF